MMSSSAARVYAPRRAASTYRRIALPYYEPFSPIFFAILNWPGPRRSRMTRATFAVSTRLITPNPDAQTQRAFDELVFQPCGIFQRARIDEGIHLLGRLECGRDDPGRMR